MSTLEDNDYFVIQRDGVTSAVANQNRSELEETDMFLVQREGVTYRVAAEDVGLANDPPIITDVTLTQDQVNSDRFTSNSFTSSITNLGGEVVTTLMTASVTGEFNVRAGSADITSNNYPGTSSSSISLNVANETNLNTLLVPGDVVTASAVHTPETDPIESAADLSYTDGMEWIQGQPSSNPIYADSNLFNGDAGTPVYIYGLADEGPGPSILKVTFNPPIENVTDLAIYLRSASMGGSATANNGSTTGFTSSAGNWHSIPSPPSTLTSITFTPQYEQGDSWNPSAIRVNGTILTDASLTGKRLNLASEKDIKLFQVGDVVQTDYPSLNRDRIWSNGITTTSTFNDPPAFAFDFDTTNTCRNNAQPSGQSRINIPFNPPISVSQTVEIVGGTGSGDMAYAVIGGTNQNAVALTTNNTGSENYQTLFTGSGLLSEIVVYDNVDSSTGNQCGFSSIKIDGKRLVDASIEFETDIKVTATDVSAKTITVDGGEWDTSNQSQVWSSGTKSGSTYPTYSWTAAFNGTITGSPGSAHTVIQASGDFTQLDFTGFSSISSVKVVYYGGTGGQIYINYGEPSQQLHAATTKGDPGEGVQPSHTFTASELKNIRLTNPSSDNAPYLYAIYVDGKLLVDQGVRDLGDTKVSTASPKQGEGTVSNITDNVVTIEPFTDNCFKEGQYLTVDKEVLVYPKTDPIAGYDVSTKTLTLDGPTDLGQFTNGDPVYMCDADGNQGPFTFESDSIESVDAEKLWLKDATWSAQVTSGTNPANAFDGNTATSCSTASNGTVIWNASEFNLTGSSIEAKLNGLLTVTTNVKEYTAYTASAAVPEVLSIEFDGEETIQTVTTHAGTGAPGGSGIYGTGLYYIKVDRKILVDTGVAGDPVSGNSILTLSGPKDLAYFREGDVVQGQRIWNQDKIWSEFGNSQTFQGDGGNYDKTKLFNGSIDSYLDCTLGPEEQGSEYWVWEYPDGIPFSQIKIRAAKYGTNPNGTLKINGEPVTNLDSLPVWPSFADPIVPTFDNPIGDRLTKIELSGWVSTGAIGLQAVYLDDLMLVDAGIAGDIYSTIVSISKPEDTNYPSITVDGGEWYADPANGGDGSGDATGDTEVSITKTATGVVNTTSSNTMILKSSTDYWLPDYYVATDPKPLLVSTAYLQFDEYGTVSGYQNQPANPVSMLNKTAPKLTFPTQFSALGTSPDEEFSDPMAKLKTTVTMNNEAEFGTSTRSSNELAPTTTTGFAVPDECEVCYNVQEAAQMASNVQSKDIREATKRLIDAEETVSESYQRIKQFVDNYVNTEGYGS